jgi:hypothetical protein
VHQHRGSFDKDANHHARKPVEFQRNPGKRYSPGHRGYGPSREHWQPVQLRPPDRRRPPIPRRYRKLSIFFTLSREIPK